MSTKINKGPKREHRAYLIDERNRVVMSLHHQQVAVFHSGGPLGSLLDKRILKIYLFIY